nr:hypothetical protein EC90111_1516 [Escherichia coli 9.0111]
MRGLPSGVVPAVRQPLAEDKHYCHFSAMSGLFVQQVVQVHCLTGYYVT